MGDDLASSEVEVVPQRQYTLQEVDLLARATGFEVRRCEGRMVWCGVGMQWL